MTPPQAGPQTLTARCPEDLLAVSRVVLGFEPSDSVVMLTVGDHQFHARIDLPADDADVGTVVDSLVRPAVQHRVDTTVLLLYTVDARLARVVARRVRRTLERAGVGVVDALRTDGDRWYPLFRDRHGLGVTGVPYDVATHPFVAAAVVDGRVLHASRGELAATLAPVPGLVAEVAAARPAEPADAPWVRALVRRHLADGTIPDPAAAARLLEAVTDPVVREAVWSGVRRDQAREHVRLWSDLVRRAPEDLVPHAASVLAVAAWLSGDGALAWCGVDRAREVDPDHPLADLVASLLLAAVPPDDWDRLVDRHGGFGP